MIHQSDVPTDSYELVSAMSRFTEDELLASRALAAGWTATVSEARIPGPEFRAAWVWLWESPDPAFESMEVWASPQDGFTPALNDELRDLFRGIDIISPNEVDPSHALAELLYVLEKDLKWLLEASRRERVFEAFSAAYNALGSEMPESVKQRLRDRG